MTPSKSVDSMRLVVNHLEQCPILVASGTLRAVRGGSADVLQNQHTALANSTSPQPPRRSNTYAPKSDQILLCTLDVYKRERERDDHGSSRRSSGALGNDSNAMRPERRFKCGTHPGNSDERRGEILVGGADRGHDDHDCQSQST